MTSEHMATPHAAAGTGGSGAHDVLSQLRELLAADEAATVIIGIDGTPIDANAGRRRRCSARRAEPAQDDVPTLRDVLDQVPQQLLLDPEGGVWRGEIDLSRPGGPTCIQACTVLVRHDPLSSAGGFIGIICRDVSDERMRSAELLHLLEHDPTTGLLNRAAAIERIANALRRAVAGRR